MMGYHTPNKSIRAVAYDPMKEALVICQHIKMNKQQVDKLVLDIMKELDYGEA